MFTGGARCHCSIFDICDRPIRRENGRFWIKIWVICTRKFGGVTSLGYGWNKLQIYLLEQKKWHKVKNSNIWYLMRIFDVYIFACFMLQTSWLGGSNRPERPRGINVIYLEAINLKQPNWRQVSLWSYWTGGRIRISSPGRKVASNLDAEALVVGHFTVK